MAEKQYPISVDELVGPYEVLEDIVAKRNILTKTSEVSNSSPDAALPIRNQLTFSQKWERCRNQFSTFAAKRIDLLIDTVCRDIVLHHILSRKGQSLAVEISKLDQLPGSLINTDLMDSKSVVGTHLTQSNESSNKLCEGHEYDRFGVVIPHPEPLPCPPELIAAVCTRTHDEALKCTSLEEVCDKLNIGWDEFKEKEKVYRSGPPIPILVQTICHLHLQPRSFKPWTDNLKFVRNVNRLLRSEKLRGKYRFVLGKSVLSRDSHNGTLYSVDCINAHTGHKLKNTAGYGRDAEEEYLGCRGRFEVCVYPKLNVIAFSNRHKHHTEGYVSDGFWDFHFKFDTNVKTFLDEESVTEDKALKMLRSAFPKVCSLKIKAEYDFALKGKDKLDESMWLSLMKFHKFYSSKFAQFTFYSAGCVGYAVIYKGFVESMTGAVESAGLHTKKFSSEPECEVVAAIADVCGEGIPVGYMLISPLNEVAKDVLTAHPATTKNGDAEGFDAERPLPQCEIAKMVESVCKSRFPTNPKLALISSFLLLLKGTKNPMLVSQLGCRNSPLPKAYRPSCSTFEETVCPMAAKIDPDHELYWKRTPRVNVPYFACERDLNQIQALAFTHPESLTLLGFSEVLKFLNPALETLETQKDSYTDFINHTRFPFAFLSLCPQMFDKVPHSAETCPYKTTPSLYKCWQCHPEFYNTRTEPKLYIPDLPEKEIFPEVDKADNKECTYSKLVHMMIEHAAASPKIPQLFTYLSMMVPVPKQARFYPLDGLHELILGDMLSFCLKFGVLHIFRYLWAEWYSEKWFGMWTRCKTNVCKLLARQPTLPVFESMFDNTHFNETFENRIDNFHCNKKKRIDSFVIYQYGHLRKIKENLKFITEFVKIPTPDVSGFPHPEWSNRRWRFLQPLRLDGKSAPHRSELKRDCVQYGTDVIMFVCGCNAYKKNDFHLCEHIMRGINYDSPLRFDDIRARSSPPFYMYDRCDEKFPSDAYTWKTLIFNEHYLKFWNTKGGHIVERHGGRKWHEQNQTPFKAKRKEEVRKRKMKRREKKERRRERAYEQGRWYDSDCYDDYSSDNSDFLYFR